jgi:hypothetical protein
MQHQTTGQGVTATVVRNPATGHLTVSGSIHVLGPFKQTIDWIAAAPVTRGISFSGSGQPYPNRAIAFEETPNKGSVESLDGRFHIELTGIPAGYYSGLGAVYVPPCIEFHVRSPEGQTGEARLWIAETAAPFRWIGGAPPTLLPQANTPTSTGRAMYYAGNESLGLFSNQEALLRARGYPSDMTARGMPEADDSAPWYSVPSP